MAESSPPPTEARVVAPKPKRKALRAYLVVAALAGAALAAYFIHGYMTRDLVSTDDAQVDADVVPIGTRVMGPIVELKVGDNQPVKKNDLIAVVDKTDYESKRNAAKAELDAALAAQGAANAQVEIVKSTAGGSLAAAKAQLGGASASVGSARAQVAQASAQVEKAKSDLTRYEADLARQKSLHDQGAITAQQLETAQAAYNNAKASVDAANAGLQSARNMESVAESRIGEAQGNVTKSGPVDQQVAAANAQAALAKSRVDSATVALANAEQQLKYCEIRSPVDGYTSKLGAHVGQIVQPGSMLLMVVPAESYVIANFKETQLERISIGDEVDVSIDALSGSFHGKVASISAATGARFSLMPPDNATGNFVKVVQRVPVKIEWDKDTDFKKLHAGLSAEVTVHLTR